MTFPGGYDTVHFFSEFQPGSLSSIQYWGETTKANGLTWKSGGLRNLTVYYSEAGTCIQGSLPRYRYGTNCRTLGAMEVKETIEMLSNDIGISLHEASVSRLDFAQTLIMDHTPKAYYSILSTMPGLKRIPYPSSLCYRNGREKLIFYDKAKQAKKKKIQTPDHWSGCNVLRPELCLYKPKRIFNRTLTGENLSDEHFFSTIARRYWDRYNSIHKVKPIRLHMETIKKPNDFFACLGALGIDVIGMENTQQIIDELKAIGTFNNPKAYYRLTARVRELSGGTRYTDASPLLEELTRKIQDVL